MKRIFSILLALALVLALSLVALPVAANTSASSTIYFESQPGFDLTDNGDGTYTGVIPCKVGAGYDIFAKEGATAYMDDTPVVIGSDHDAWPTWNPDTPDWYQYSLNLWVSGGTQYWELRNHAGATAGNPWYTGGDPARGVPMSGYIEWGGQGIGYAHETGTGAYLAGMGTAKYPGKAASHGGGAGYWDMDWSWGSEAVPLQYPGFQITVASGGSYVVTMTPGEPTSTATGTGTASFSSNAGTITGLTGVAAPSGAPTTFPHGMFSFTVTGLAPGGTVTLTVELPGPVPVGTKWWKYQNGSWYWLPIGDDDGDNLITVTLKDSSVFGQGDGDGAINGQITDPGGLGWPVGWETYPVSKARVLLPWIALGLAIAAGFSLLVLRRRRAQS